MPEHSKNASEIFEIERIGNSDSSENCEKPSRSLVFKISKKVCKNSNNKEVGRESSARSYESKDAAEKEYIEKSNPNKENRSNDPVDTTENVKKCSEVSEAVTQAMENVQLRRSSRRVMVRTKEEHSPDPHLNKRKKIWGKIHKAIQEKKKHGRRGRPRKNPPLQFPDSRKVEFEKPNSSLSWTPLPKQLKECSNLCCPGENHNRSWEQSNTALSQETFSENENTRSRDVCAKQEHYLSKSSRKPTIIYFKCPKNRPPLSVPGDGHSNQLYSFKNSLECIPFSQQEYNNFNHLRKKYSIINEAILHQFYNQTERDISKTETMLQDLLMREIMLLRGQDIHLSMKNSEKTCQVSAVAKSDRGSTFYNSTKILESDVSVKDHRIETEEVDTLYRQVIIDSIKILYDEQSVTGYL